MVVDPSTLTPRERYRWLTACLVPRPVAWLSTLAADGTANLAPFSFFGGVTSDPPIVMVSIGRRQGRRKDTASNLLATGQAVVHIPDRVHAEAMVATSAEVPPEVDEFDLTRLGKLPSLRVRPWRIAGAPLAFECEVERHLEAGAGPVDVFLLRVLLYHVEDGLVVDGLPDPARLCAVGRLGGESYSDTSAPFRVARPG